MKLRRTPGVDAYTFMKWRQIMYWTALTKIASYWYCRPNERLATRDELEAAFIECEKRILALEAIGNHAARQKTRWLGRWQQRIMLSLSFLPRRRAIYRELS